ncbi:MAG: hypothetical protein COV70_02185 [Parcubacteria group bacterium CG11_big_fil_rev_8_21_14_0_20_39_22]|nr:MAG: hypothetical protein COV70_02185 [Parcubacteria group bacterium CG11_big_fil_rev_8_21_14_0_20_39_22]
MEKKVLIIEQGSFINDKLSKKLRDEGYNVFIATDGGEGLETIRSRRPELVLLDVKLPSMDGYAVLEKKRNEKEIKNIPVIIITDSSEPDEISRALSLGVRDYLIKSNFEIDDVMEKVRLQMSSDGNYKEEDPVPQRHDSFVLSGKTILWVEDDKFLSDIISRKLTTSNCNLIHAKTGEEALSILKDKTPDVILLDILLPGIDGWEILRRIKEHSESNKVPVILLSNLGQKADIDKGVALGAECFLVKATVTFDDIIEEMASVIKKYAEV